MWKIWVARGLLVVIAIAWFLDAKSQAYAEPNEALLAVENNMVLIPGYKVDKEALFFFFKGKNGLGATYVDKGLLGWKAGVLSWSQMGTHKHSELLNNSRGLDDRLLYGIIQINDGDNRSVQMNGTNAVLLNLEMLPLETVEAYELEDTFIWFFETDTPIDKRDIQLIDNDTGDVIDSL